MGYFVLWGVKHTRKPHLLPYTELPQFPLNSVPCSCCLNVDGCEKPNCCCCRQTLRAFGRGRGGPAQMWQVAPVPPTLPFLMQICFVQVNAWPETAFLAVTISALRGGNVCSLMSLCKGTPVHYQRQEKIIFFPSLGREQWFSFLLCPPKSTVALGHVFNHLTEGPAKHLASGRAADLAG